MFGVDRSSAAVLVALTLTRPLEAGPLGGILFVDPVPRRLVAVAGVAVDDGPRQDDLRPQERRRAEPLEAVVDHRLGRQLPLNGPSEGRLVVERRAGRLEGVTEAASLPVTRRVAVEAQNARARGSKGAVPA